MTKINYPLRPDWLTDADEMPHDHEGVSPAWSENYLSYVWSPSNAIGIYVHLCCRPGTPTVWDEQLQIVLPGDRYLVSKGMSPGRIENGPSVCGISFYCDEPYKQWTKRFQGGARLVSGEEMRAGPLKDGEHIPVEIELVYEAMSPPFDFGTGTLDQAWAAGHYEQHHRVSGWITFAGERHEIKGTGLRDHSWGERHYSEIGASNWLHAQFPDSGRSLMVVLVTGKPPKSQFTYACVSDGETVSPVRPSELPVAKNLADTETSFEFELTTEEGTTSTVKATIINSFRAALVGASEIALGTFQFPGASHHYIDAFSRFEWDGEVGYGIIERTVDLEN